MKKLFAGLVGILIPLPVMAAQTQTVPAGTPVTITVSPAAPSAPPVSINLKSRHGHVTPYRTGFTHLGGGTIDIQQPTADVLQVTMFGVAVAGGHPTTDSIATMSFDLCQDFEVSFDDPKVKAAKFSIEARALGLLRSACGQDKGCGKGCGSCGKGSFGHKTGTASEEGHASVTCDTAEIVSVTSSPHSVGGGEDLSINCHDGPVEQTPIKAGKYVFHQTFVITATHPRSILPCCAASAEFDPAALDPLWISYWEPFHGASKKDFGFQVILKVADDSPKDEPKPEEKKPEEKKPAVRLY